MREGRERDREGRGGEAGGGSLPVVFTADKIKKLNRCGWGLCVGKKNFSGAQSKISWQWKCSKKLYVGLLGPARFLISFFCVKSLCIFNAND